MSATVAQTARPQVVVIGSGPVGLTLANLLGQLGVRTMLVERNATTVQEPRAVSIDDESLRTMQAAGVVDIVAAATVSGYGSHYYGPDGTTFARVEPSGRPYGYPRRNAFRQPVLEGQLRTAVARFPWVETRFGWSMQRCEIAQDHVALGLVGPGEAPSTVVCDYVVGCDGAASTVRGLQGVELAGTTFDERWLIIDLENNENTRTHTEVFCDPARPCITLPGPDRTRRYEFKLLPGETDDDLLAPAMVERLLATHGADPRATLRRTVVYRFHARVAPRWSFGRAFLAGDAAHLTPPFAGQGMNSGIRDAQNLAWKLAAVLQGRLGARVLDSYEVERRDHIWQMIRLALRMGQVMSPRTALHGRLIRTGFRLLNVWPPARDYIAQMRYKPAPYFEAGFLVRAGGRGDRLVGRLLPQPRVTTAAGISCLLDDLAGARFVLLMRGAAAVSALKGMVGPVWDRLDPVRIALIPRGIRAMADAGIVTVTEEDDRLGSVLTEHTVVLLRPDHYVMAVMPPGAAAATVRAIGKVLDECGPTAVERLAEPLAA